MTQYKSFRTALQEVANFKTSDLDKYKNFSSALDEVKQISSTNKKPDNDTGETKGHDGVDPTVKDWHQEHVHHSPNDSVTASAAYEHYCLHCDKDNKEPLALPTFGRHLRKLRHKDANVNHDVAKIGGRARWVNMKLSKLDEHAHVTTSDKPEKKGKKKDTMKKEKEEKEEKGYTDLEGTGQVAEHRIIAKNALAKLSESFIWRKNAGAIADHLFEMLNDGKLTKDQPLNECILSAYESLKSKGNLK